MITNRQKEILKFIVEEYVKTVKPVSSSIICKHLNCSSATVRNEMVLLEKTCFALYNEGKSKERSVAI